MRLVGRRGRAPDAMYLSSVDLPTYFILIFCLI